ncbi:MAG: hypothetical protein ACXWHB_07915 [Usitatibacter sp.]
MNTFKRKALASAVLGTLGVAGSAHAIYQDPTNLGQVLIYPYYTVQNQGTNAFNTFISVTNTTSAVKVVKVRFREGKNSREVLDFNLYLSPNDMWTGAVIPASTDVTSPARLVTADVSCTNPAIPAGGIDFRNYEYTGTAADLLATGLDRTREGYAEMFEMGQLAPGAAPGSAAVHGASGSPSCTGLTGPALPLVGAALTAPTGGLFGTGTLINVNSGRDTMYNANAFGQWRTAALYTDIGTDTPNFNDTSPATSIVVSQNTTGTLTAYFSSWSSTATAALTVSAGARAASATMMHSDVLNEYILDAVTRSGTDWVLTFPTKRAFVNAGTAIAPFSNLMTANGACETIDFTYFNREERTATSTGGDFSPLPPSAAPNSLCWESTVLSFRNGSTNAPTPPSTGVTSLVLGSVNVTSVTLASSTTFQNGWATMHFSGAGASTTGLVSDGGNSITIATGAPVAGAQTFRGLPVVGFMIRTFDNGNLTCGTATCQGSYGGSVSHAYRNNITP